MTTTYTTKRLEAHARRLGLNLRVYFTSGTYVYVMPGDWWAHVLGHSMAEAKENMATIEDYDECMSAVVDDMIAGMTE